MVAPTARRHSDGPTTAVDGEEAPAGRERSLTLERGLALLQAVADAESDAPSISDLATAIGASRAAVYRMLGPLQARGLVRREGSKVRLGLGVLRLANRVLPQVRFAALPALRVLAEQVGATAHITVADGMDAQAVAVVEPSWTTFHVSYRVGTRHPVRFGAAGRAIDLAPDAGGWVVSNGELQAGAHGVAAPVIGVDGLRASVGVIALAPLDVPVVGPQVMRAACEIAAALG
ncbi:IclR family transcriptional regulator [Actinoalloteichus hymeniacidonis]|uniref:Transcriptional regulator n=1 Tax=Actinoalloteichus hymeniacidonis TaxID=340345 RepID=A0AAC9MWD1_9PSEU|nr:helix-turn-helix domain-containing protein [Actinoalloteichus hymeniacidonis]AOS60959.1 transcriptional regulator [Actinoalloteichus hymeniacidonis]MBB5911041.1 DNA-binding IclR family transcriptional regulator [Actinoalloteichus hymeniacidonis]